MMDGLLVVDKPIGPTSHDVVAAMRRALDQRRIGHTGTLDPRASGVLPLVIGRATRLSRFLSAQEKSYEAVIELGARTTTYDAEGTRVGDLYSGPWPSPADIEGALTAFTGTFWQQPPVFSAKKIAGRRSYRTARATDRMEHPGGRVPIPAPVEVTVKDIQVTAVHDRHVTIRLTCSSGFYVRSLADDLGQRLGTGGYLERLRRTRSGDLSLASALGFRMLVDNPAAARNAVVPMEEMLPGLPCIWLSESGARRATRGQDVGFTDFASAAEPAGASDGQGGPPTACARLLGPDGRVVALAEPSPKPGFLHPSVVLV